MNISAIDNKHFPAPSVQNTAQNSNASSFADVLHSEQSKLGSKSLITEFFSGVKMDATGSIHLEELESHGMESLERFNKNLLKELKSIGVDTDKEISLRTEHGSGRVIVENNHPDKERIEKYFDDNFSVRNEYTRITNMLHLAELGKQTSNFHAAYRNNPEAAVAQYSYLFSSDLVPSVTLKDGDIDIMFDWQAKRSA